ncbi:unnamed protein product [Ectocarpus sp. 8 AP-2014]
MVTTKIALALCLTLPASRGTLDVKRGEGRTLLETVPGGFESSATGGKVFAMEQIRAFEGPRVDFDAAEILPGPPPADEEMCEKWAVLTSIFEPTETVKQLAELSGWCVVVVGDKNGPAEYHVTGVKYLTPGDQDALPYRITEILPWNHFGRKNVGYMYAIQHGAKVIYDVDDDNALIHPEEGVPHAGVSSIEDNVLSRFSGHPSSSVHNPYGCFGAPGVSWPRGYPLSAIQDDSPHHSAYCDVDGISGSRIGVVQALANHDPDVDAIYRLTYPPGGLPFSFNPGAPGTPESTLRGVPADKMTPYNAQATLHFPVAFWGMLLPVTVHGRVSDIWRSYFTQALLPLANAVPVFAPAWVEQIRNPHDYLGDFQAELPLYERAGALVEFLLWYADEKGASNSGGLTWSLVEDLAVMMYEYGIVDEEDVVLTQAWLQDLRDSGYDLEDVTGQQGHPLQVSVHQGGSPSSSAIEPLDSRANVMLVIAVVSARPDRRRALRQSWLTWEDERVEVRFFVEKPEPGSAHDTFLAQESAAHGDIVMMDIDPGMNFGLKLVWALRWMSDEFTFDFFLRLDDDYFLCLRRLLDELEIARAVAEAPLRIYGGLVMCNVYQMTRIDEAFMLLSEDLVRRVVDTPDLQCASDAGTTASWWFAEGHPLNQLGDVKWVNDPRLDHFGRTINGPPELFADVCVAHMGVHHSYPEQMGIFWEAAKDKPGPAPGETGDGSFILSYVSDDTCNDTGPVTDELFRSDRFEGQSCDTFKSNRNMTMWCGKKGC